MSDPSWYNKNIGAAPIQSSPKGLDRLHHSTPRVAFALCAGFAMPSFPRYLKI